MTRLLDAFTRLVDAVAKLMVGWPGAVTAILALGGVLGWWRYLALRQKKLDAALGVLEALDRTREAFHAARRQDIPMSAAVSPHHNRERQMTLLRDENVRAIGRLHTARDSLLDAQAKAVALWGDSAKGQFQPIYRHVDLLTMSSNRYWPEAIRIAHVHDSNLGQPSVINFPQPTEMMYGHSGDSFGREMDAAINAAVLWYERRAGLNRSGKS